MTTPWSDIRLAGSRLFALLTAFGLVLVAMALSPARPAHAAADVSVFVGYADNARANPTHYPTPWAGSPNVTFDGCQPAGSCIFDAGAARIVNNTPVPVTIDSVVLKFDTCVYDIWHRGTVLQPGRELIVTQTASGTGRGCTPGTGLMDSSDIGPGGVPWDGHCNQSGVIPEVDVSVDGVASVFRDSGQVLNTGGVDAADCAPVFGNESEQWTLIGMQPCSGASLTLAPPSQTRLVGSTATVQATLTNSCGTGLANARVDFSVLSGPNTGLTGNGTTNAGGVATFSYSSAVAGTDLLRAAVTNLAGTFTSNTVNVIWVRPAPILTGRAYGIAARGVVNILPSPDTGPVATAGSLTVVAPCVLAINGPVITARTLCARVVTAAGPGTSTATASLEDARIGVPRTPVIRLGLVQVASRTSCAGSAGDTSIASLRVGNTAIGFNLRPAPNTTITIAGVRLVLNEQIHGAGVLTVNGVHITIPGLLDVVISSATSDIHGC